MVDFHIVKRKFEYVALKNGSLCSVVRIEYEFSKISNSKANTLMAAVWIRQLEGEISKEKKPCLSNQRMCALHSTKSVVQIQAPHSTKTVVHIQNILSGIISTIQCYLRRFYRTSKTVPLFYHHYHLVTHAIFSSLQLNLLTNTKLVYLYLYILYINI